MFSTHRQIEKYTHFLLVLLQLNTEFKSKSGGKAFPDTITIGIVYLL